MYPNYHSKSEPNNVDLWIRPKDMFTESVQYQGNIMLRFSLLENPSGSGSGTCEFTDYKDDTCIFPQTAVHTETQEKLMIYYKDDKLWVK